ncbi:MAG: hypothetical protein ACI807_003368 [Paracoccaceae bacterium]|jgi:hypothetical protein
MFPQIKKAECRMVLRGDAPNRYVRNQDLIGTGRAFKPAEHRQRQPEEIIAARTRNAHMHAATDLKPSGPGPLRRTHVMLGGDGRVRRVCRIVEHRNNAVASVLERISAKTANCAMEQPVMQVHRHERIVGMASVKDRTANDVGREKGEFPRFTDDGLCRQVFDSRSALAHRFLIHPQRRLKSLIVLFTLQTLASPTVGHAGMWEIIITDYHIQKRNPDIWGKKPA